jgi:hypothetical protein
LSWRKLDLRATDEPLMAALKCPSRVDATRGSNSSGIFPGFGRVGLSRATARSPASRPISSAASRSPMYRALCHAWSRCIPAPSPAMTPAEQLYPVARNAPANPAEVASATLDAEALAEAPLELVTPGTASAASSAAKARARSWAGSGS